MKLSNTYHTIILHHPYIDCTQSKTQNSIIGSVEVTVKIYNEKHNLCLEKEINKVIAKEAIMEVYF